MKTLMKSMFLTSICTISGLTLSGCSFGLNPDALEVSLNSEYSPGVFSDRTYTILSIRSINSEPITVTAVNVNDGRCGYSQRYGNNVKLPAHFQIGQVLTLYLKCSYDSVVKVDVETDQGDASYSFK